MMTDDDRPGMDSNSHLAQQAKKVADALTGWTIMLFYVFVSICETLLWKCFIFISEHLKNYLEAVSKY